MLGSLAAWEQKWQMASEGKFWIDAFYALQGVSALNLPVEIGNGWL